MSLFLSNELLIRLPSISFYSLLSELFVLVLRSVECLAELFILNLTIFESRLPFSCGEKKKRMVEFLQLDFIKLDAYA